MCLGLLFIVRNPITSQCIRDVSPTATVEPTVMPQDDMLGKNEWSRSFTLLMFLRFTGGGHRMRESSFMRTITWRRMERTGGGNIERNLESCYWIV